LALEPRFDNLVALRARLYALEQNWEAVDRWTTETLKTKDPRSVQWILLVRMAAWRGDPDTVNALIPVLEQGATIQAPQLVSLCRSILSRTLSDEQRSAFKLMLALIPGTERARCAYHQIAAETFALVVDEAGAIASIERAVQSGLFDLEWMDRCPSFATMRESLAFQSAREVVLGRANRVRAAFGEPAAT
jgi:serine/threonine-protein kinase